MNLIRNRSQFTRIDPFINGFKHNINTLTFYYLFNLHYNHIAYKTVGAQSIYFTCLRGIYVS